MIKITKELQAAQKNNSLNKQLIAQLKEEKQLAEKSLKDVLWEWKEVMSDSESAELFDQKVAMIELK